MQVYCLTFTSETSRRAAKFVDTSVARLANHGAVAELDLVAALVYKDLSIVGGLALVALCRDHDPHPRPLGLVHRDQQQIVVAETEERDLRGIVEFDRRQAAELFRNLDGQLLSFRI